MEALGARVQIAPEEMHAVAEVADKLCQRLQAVGFSVVEIDSEGYRAPMRLNARK